MQPIRVLVVDDSIVVRRLVTDALGSDPDIEVVATAANGQIAVDKVASLAPDVVTMDIEMPVLDGIGAVRALRTSGFRNPIIMFSTLTQRGASATLDALAAGANDYVTKPSNVGSVQESIAQVKDQLVPRIKALVGARRFVSTATPARPPVITAQPPTARRAVRAVLIGSSTGGPEALAQVLTAMPGPLPVPILITQHMPPVFTGQLAARLDRLSRMTVVEAEDGQPVIPGTAYIAPGDRHLTLTPAAAGPRTRLDDGPPVHFCRPSVDVLFKSAVTAYKGDLLCVVLTGMGSDGRDGARAVVDAGGTTIAQDEATSVVWGMPGAVTQAGLAHHILPLPQIAETITRIVRGQR